MEGNIDGIFIIATVGSAKRTTEKLFFVAPPLASKMVVDPHRHRQIGWVDRWEALFPAVSPHCSTSRPCSHLLRRATTSSPQPLTWRGHRRYISWGARFKQVSKRPNESSPQLDYSSEDPSKAPHCGQSLEPSIRLLKDSIKLISKQCTSWWAIIGTILEAIWRIQSWVPKQGLKKACFRPHSRTLQLDTQAMHPLVGHN